MTSKLKKNQYPSPYTTRVLCDYRGIVGSYDFSVLVDGAHIQGLEAVAKIHAVQKRTSQG